MEAISPVKSGEIKPPESVSSLAPEIMDPGREKVAKIHKELEKKSQQDPHEVREDTRSKIENIAQALDQYVKSTQRDLKIQVHEATGNIMVKVISKEDGKVLREIPAEKMLNLAAKMEEMTGVLFNENV